MKTRVLLLLFALLACAPAHAIAVGDQITRSGWTATLRYQAQRLPSSYVYVVSFQYSGIPTMYEWRELRNQPTNSQIIAAVNAAVDELEATRLFWIWAQGALPGQSKVISGWTATCDAIGANVERRAVVMTLTVTKGTATRTFQVDIVTRTQSLPAVAKEITAFLEAKIAAVAEKQTVPDDSGALAGVVE